MTKVKAGRVARGAPRKAIGFTLLAGKPKKHPFFTDRSITEGYIVSRIDDFVTSPDTNGGFHTPMYLGKGADANSNISA